MDSWLLFEKFWSLENNHLWTFPSLLQDAPGCIPLVAHLCSCADTTGDHDFLCSALNGLSDFVSSISVSEHLLAKDPVQLSLLPQ